MIAKPRHSFQPILSIPRRQPRTPTKTFPPNPEGRSRSPPAVFFHHQTISPNSKTHPDIEESKYSNSLIRHLSFCFVNRNLRNLKAAFSLERACPRNFDSTVIKARPFSLLEVLHLNQGPTLLSPHNHNHQPPTEPSSPVTSVLIDICEK